jgi:hypothetical protein
VLDRDNRRDRFSMKKPLHSSARGASSHTKHASNANVVRVGLLDANSYLALWSKLKPRIEIKSPIASHLNKLPTNLLYINLTINYFLIRCKLQDSFLALSIGGIPL